MTHSLLIVEDDKNLRETLADNLELEGFKVFTAGTLEAGKRALESTSIDLIVLDVMLPDGEGFSLCRWAQQNMSVSILILSARTLEKDIVEGFIAGCDDYVSKPYRATELILRIKALLRRHTSAKLIDQNVTTTSNINGFTVDWGLRVVKNQGQDLHLTKTAFNILEYLYQHRNQCCSRDDILDNVWGKNMYVDNRTIDNFVSQLKKQLSLSGEKPFKIKTIRGVGYSLVA